MHLKALYPTCNSWYPLGELFLIGRDPNCNIVIHQDNIEARHARIEKKPEGFILRDLRSRLGSYLNSVKVYEAPLKNGDIIAFGESEFIVVEDMTCSLPLSVKSKNLLWQKQLEKIPSIAKTFYPVLLLGPSGTGKEVIAKAIHEHSSRAQGPFISVNCSALTETLIESELFGHIKGSFTGAIHDRKGAFETARGGTLFLDEIGDLPYSLQAKLLRALENCEVRPVGADKTIKTDVRIIAATHQNLIQQVADKTFRSDLFFRLNVINIKTLPLKERMEDFESLMYEFAKDMRVRFSYEAIAQLKKHSWPGNIRELKNVVARCSAMFPNQRIESDHLTAAIDIYPEQIIHELFPMPSFNSTTQETSSTALQKVSIIKEMERQMILQRLAANRGNQRKTAFELGIPKSTLHDRLRTYNIDPKTFFEKSGF